MLDYFIKSWHIFTENFAELGGLMGVIGLVFLFAVFLVFYKISNAFGSRKQG